jgi:methyl-accepting chemotaxis protein
MDEVTQQNAALVEEAAAAAESLEEQARGLVQAVGMFRLASGSTNLPAVARSANDDLDFDAAIGAHQKWKQRLLSFVADTSHEKLDPAVVGCDDKCALGQWIYGSCKPLMASDPRCQNLVTAHANFHRCAGEIVRYKLADRKRDAMTVLKGDFTKYSDETVRHIETMRVAWSARAAGTNRQSAYRTPELPAKVVPARLAHDEDEWQEF